MATGIVIDGLDALRAEIGVREIASLIERTARWVAPETFRLLPIWFPEHARGRSFYKGNWSEPQMNKSRATGTTVHKVEGNNYANSALGLALGITRAERPNWSCCHIWGVDDPTYQKPKAIVQDRRFYSCVGNMVMLPTPLKAFTDSMPEIKAMLRICAQNLYGWHPEHEALAELLRDLETWRSWDDYPATWPRDQGEKRPLGTVEITPEITNLAEKRLREIRRDIALAGEFYPRDDVIQVLEYWGIPAVCGRSVGHKDP